MTFNIRRPFEEENKASKLEASELEFDTFTISCYVLQFHVVILCFFLISPVKLCYILLSFVISCYLVLSHPMFCYFVFSPVSSIHILLLQAIMCYLVIWVYRTIRDTGNYSTKQDHMGQYKTLWDNTGPYGAIWNLKGPYGTLQYPTGRARKKKFRLVTKLFWDEIGCKFFWLE